MPLPPIRFEPSEPYQGFTRIVVMLGPDCIGTIAERRDGMHEFVPHRCGAFCAALCLPDGPHVAKTASAISRLVRGLLVDVALPEAETLYKAVRPDGRVWDRPFSSEAAAWRAVVGGTNGTRDRRKRKADLVRAGWRVRLAPDRL